MDTVSFQILTVAVVVSPFGLLMVISFSWEVMTWEEEEEENGSKRRRRERTFRIHDDQ